MEKATIHPHAADDLTWIRVIGGTPGCLVARPGSASLTVCPEPGCWKWVVSYPGGCATGKSETERGAKEAAKSALSREIEHSRPMTGVTIRLNAADVLVVDDLQKKTGIANRTDIIRHAIRQLLTAWSCPSGEVIATPSCETIAETSPAPDQPETHAKRAKKDRTSRDPARKGAS